MNDEYDYETTEVDPFGFCPEYINRKQRDDFKEPRRWNIISALSRVLEMGHNSKLSSEFWTSCKRPINYLTKKLGLTKGQVVLLALMIEAGEPVSWRMIANFFDCPRLSVMVYSDDMEGLVSKRWAMHSCSREEHRHREAFSLVKGVITAMRKNQVFIPEKIDGFNEQEFVDKLERYVRRMEFNSELFHYNEDWMYQFCQANHNLPICQEVLNSLDIHSGSLLLLTISDYAKYANTDEEGIDFNFIDAIYPEDYDCDALRRDLQAGTHELMDRCLIEFKCEDGIVNNNCYRLTANAKERLLSNYIPRNTYDSPMQGVPNLLSHAKIKEKTLFYNDSEEKQVAQITSLMSQNQLTAIQQRLEEQGMRKGVACLFYGAPGTGKTETVLQLARQTGRNIMQVNIAGLRDKWVGESEKNIKAVFNNYRELCNKSEVMPILFFNEADAIINKRIENVSQSVDKMDNSMQNIILQELETLDGILIATTNLTSNLDPAFERRFLFKVEFHKPDTEVKAKIWHSMMNDLKPEEAHVLASKYDFSGGQIENIARKRSIDYVLTGKYTDLATIEEYCDNELLTHKNNRKPVIGFKR